MKVHLLVAAFFTAACLLSTAAPGHSLLAASLPQTETTPTRELGTVKSISGNKIVLTTDLNAEITVVMDATAKLMRVEPGATDLKSAQPLALADVQVGDRVLVRGKTDADGKTFHAASLIAMKKGDIAQKQAHERDEWQKNGVGGLVKSVDAASGAIVVASNTPGSTGELTIKLNHGAALRRYAPNSIKFDDAKPAPISEIKVGDQLRARGARSADGKEIAADEVVSGSFRNIAGTVSGVDSAKDTLLVRDLATKTDVLVHITADTQMRKLPPPLAQRIAAQFKPAPPENGASAVEKPASQTTAVASPEANGQRQGGARGGDFQRMLSRLPAVVLTDLQKGEAVMIVATAGMGGQEVTAITLLSGVEPILTASPKGGEGMVLSPWSLGGGGASADAGAGGGAETP